jgi:hypothetical protein
VERRQLDHLDTPGNQESIGPDEPDRVLGGNKGDRDRRGCRPPTPAVDRFGSRELVRRQVTVIAAGPITAAAAAKAASTRNVDAAFVASAGLTRTATRTARGSSSCSRSSRFAANSPMKKLIPVMLPPGRARLATRPAARAIGLQVQVLNASTSGEINAAFENVGRDRPDALFAALGHKRTFRRVRPMSALPPKADSSATGLIGV